MMHYGRPPSSEALRFAFLSASGTIPTTPCSTTSAPCRYCGHVKWTSTSNCLKSPLSRLSKSWYRLGEWTTTSTWSLITRHTLEHQTGPPAISSTLVASALLWTNRATMRRPSQSQSSWTRYLSGTGTRRTRDGCDTQWRPSLRSHSAHESAQSLCSRRAAKTDCWTCLCLKIWVDDVCDQPAFYWWCEDGRLPTCF